MLAVGVDLGASKIASALVTDTGRVLSARQTPTLSQEGPAAVLARIAAEINALLAAAPGPVAGVGLGTPGIVAPSEGIVRNAVNLGWDEVPLVAGVCAALDRELPIFIQKDTNASALGEYYFGAARGCSDFVYLSVGSGLGGGLIANGQILTGAAWQASELGHFSLDPEGRPCVCGLRGCAETAVSGPGLVTLSRERLASGDYPASQVDAAALTPAAVLAAARAGDALARDVFTEMGATLGVVMAACVAVLNPAAFVIGGGLGLAAFDLLIPPARLALAKRVIAASIAPLEILPSTLKSSAIGPSCLVWYARNDPK